MFLLVVISAPYSASQDFETLEYQNVLVRGFDNALSNDLISLIKDELRIIQTRSNVLEHGTVFLPFHNKKGERVRPRNYIELSVQLLYQQYTKREEKSKIIGGEWWTQTKKTNQGMVFHYDKDEGHYRKYAEVKNPFISTITYLNDIGCPTLILNQTRIEGSHLDSPLIPHEAFISYPKFNRHINFYGKLYHGVASSLSLQKEENDQTFFQWIYNWLMGVEEEQRRTFLINWWETKPDSSKCRELSDQSLINLNLFYPEKVKVLEEMIMANLTTSREKKSDLYTGVPVNSISLQIDNKKSTPENHYKNYIEMMPRGDALHFDLLPHHLLSNRTLYQITWGPQNIYGTVTKLDLTNPMIVNTMMITKEPKFILFHHEDHLLDETIMQTILPIAKDDKILGNAKIYISVPLKSQAAMSFYGLQEGMALPILVVDDMTSRQVKRVLWQNKDMNNIADELKNSIYNYLYEINQYKESEL